MILYVEDHPVVAHATLRILRTLGDDVTWVLTVADAVARMAEADICITDWHLPDGTGARVVDAARRHVVPCIVLTGEPDVAREYAWLDERLVLAKPATRQQVIDALHLADRLTVQAAVRPGTANGGCEPTPPRRGASGEGTPAWLGAGVPNIAGVVR